MGGRGSGSNMASAGRTDSNGFFNTLTGIEEYSRHDLTSSVDKASFVQTGNDEWRIGVSAGPERATATNYGIASSVRLYGPKSPLNTMDNSSQGKYRVSGDYYDRSFDNITAARNAARAQLKKQLGDIYDLRTRNRNRS